MNTTLTAILVLLLAGTAITKFEASQAETLAALNVQELVSAQAEQAYELSQAYGYSDTPEEAYERWYGPQE